MNQCEKGVLGKLSHIPKPLPPWVDLYIKDLCLKGFDEHEIVYSLELQIYFTLIKAKIKKRPLSNENIKKIYDLLMRSDKNIDQIANEIDDHEDNCDGGGSISISAPKIN